MSVNCPHFKYSLNHNIFTGSRSQKVQNQTLSRLCDERNLTLSQNRKQKQTKCLLKLFEIFLKRACARCQSKYANDIYIYTKQKARKTKREGADEEVHV